MSRFDRRLKGTGLSPGQSTCKIGKENTGGSPRVNQYATMSWNGNIVTGAPVPTYNPNVMIPQNSAVQQNSAVPQNSVISQTCVDYINEYYNLSNISVECENPEEDCTNDYNFYYIEFERFNNEPIFFGKLADMELLLPIEIDSSSTIDSSSNI